MPSQSLAISRIGPESDVLLRNLFEHYCHDMSEWFDVDTEADGSYSYDTAPFWVGEHEVYLARVGESIAGFAGDPDRGMFTNFSSCVSSGGAASASRWLPLFGMNIPENGWSEC